jgi:hypothetical protein
MLVLLGLVTMSVAYPTIVFGGDFSRSDLFLSDE